MEQLTQDGMDRIVAENQAQTDAALNYLRDAANTFITEHQPSTVALVSALTALAAKLIVQRAPTEAEAIRFASQAGTGFVVLVMEMLKARAQEATDADANPA